MKKEIKGFLVNGAFMTEEDFIKAIIKDCSTHQEKIVPEYVLKELITHDLGWMAFYATPKDKVNYLKGIAEDMISHFDYYNFECEVKEIYLSIPEKKYCHMSVVGKTTCLTVVKEKCFEVTNEQFFNPEEALNAYAQEQASEFGRDYQTVFKSWEYVTPEYVEIFDKKHPKH